MPTKEKIRRRCEDIVNESNTRFDDTWKAICRDWLAANPPEPAEKPMTVRVRAACAMNQYLECVVHGSNDLDADLNHQIQTRYGEGYHIIAFLEADIPAPIPQTIQATVKEKRDA